MSLRLCANIDLKSINIGENMKALIVINGENISDEKMSYLADEAALASIQRVAPNSFLFDLTKSAHALAALQGYVNKITNTYHIFYFKDDVDVFKYPVGL